MLEQILQFPKNLPTGAQAQLTPRSDACCCCGSKQDAQIISKVEFWDLMKVSMVKCPNCQHCQLDPLPSEETNGKAASAYHRLQELHHHTRRELERNSLRQFRRGVWFANTIKRQGFNPRKVLEIGPGDCFFLLGVQFVFAEAKFSILDVVPEILENAKLKFGFSGVLSTPNKFLAELKDGSYDLIIARDVLEHFSRVDLSVSNIAAGLAPGGLFHFITPTGCTDFWVFHRKWMRTAEVNELLINHLHYFDGNSLKQLLKQKSLQPVDYYSFGLKSLFKGRGWKLSYEAELQKAGTTSVGKYLNQEHAVSEENSNSMSLKGLFQMMPFKLGIRFLTNLYCAWKQKYWIYFPAELNLGEEIHGVFQKSSGS